MILNKNNKIQITVQFDEEIRKKFFKQVKHQNTKTITIEILKLEDVLKLHKIVTKKQLFLN